MHRGFDGTARDVDEERSRPGAPAVGGTPRRRIREYSGVIAGEGGWALFSLRAVFRGFDIGGWPVAEGDWPPSSQKESGGVLLECTGLDSRAVAAVLLAVAALAYNDWLLQFFLPTGLAQRDSYVSELFAADQPYRALFATIEAACGLLIAAAPGTLHLPFGAAGACGLRPCLVSASTARS
ncbi:hypothetical protein ACQPXS_44820 [Streptomyces sp. CA-142005]|uniref:hypothetical protein n=1 Tax=Streptomyces sp. CA-142005 TaxID=3240052 RepID=UPI003D8E4F99